MKIRELILSISNWSSQLLNRLQSPMLLLIRAYWGWQFAQTGWGKLHNLNRVADFFATLNIPAPHLNALVVAWLSSSAESC